MMMSPQSMQRRIGVGGSDFKEKTVRVKDLERKREKLKIPA